MFLICNTRYLVHLMTPFSFSLTWQHYVTDEDRWFRNLDDILLLEVHPDNKEIMEETVLIVTKDDEDRGTTHCNSMGETIALIDLMINFFSE